MFSCTECGNVDTVPKSKEELQMEKLRRSGEIDQATFIKYNTNEDRLAFLKSRENPDASTGPVSEKSLCIGTLIWRSFIDPPESTLNGSSREEALVRAPGWRKRR
jgi:hypothetical protein